MIASTRSVRRTKLLKIMSGFLASNSMGTPGRFVPSEDQRAGMRECLLMGSVLVQADGHRGSLDNGTSLCQ